VDRRHQPTGPTPPVPRAPASLTGPLIRFDPFEYHDCRGVGTSPLPHLFLAHPCPVPPPFNRHGLAFFFQNPFWTAPTLFESQSPISRRRFMIASPRTIFLFAPMFPNLRISWSSAPVTLKSTGYQRAASAKVRPPAPKSPAAERP